jgi:membrane protein insertase Oxa1/YidC/SpoIIIJ
VSGGVLVHPQPEDTPCSADKRPTSCDVYNLTTDIKWFSITSFQILALIFAVLSKYVSGFLLSFIVVVVVVIHCNVTIFASF